MHFIPSCRVHCALHCHVAVLKLKGWGKYRGPQLLRHPQGCRSVGVVFHSLSGKHKIVIRADGHFYRCHRDRRPLWRKSNHNVVSVAAKIEFRRGRGGGIFPFPHPSLHSIWPLKRMTAGGSESQGRSKCPSSLLLFHYKISESGHCLSLIFKS